MTYFAMGMQEAESMDIQREQNEVMTEKQTQDMECVLTSLSFSGSL